MVFRDWIVGGIRINSVHFTDQNTNPADIIIKMVYRICLLIYYVDIFVPKSITLFRYFKYNAVNCT